MGVALDALGFQTGYHEIKQNILPRIDETGLSLCRNSLLKIENQYARTIRMCSRLRVPLALALHHNQHNENQVPSPHLDKSSPSIIPYI
jgi:hypothetical protein